eukprot:Opistho-1_new@5291
MSAGLKRRNQLRQKPVLPSRPDSTFSITVRRSISAWFWNTMPIWQRTCRSAVRDRPCSSCPQNSTRPAVGSTRRFTQRISVDLPAPDGPIRPITSPAPSRRLTSTSAASAFPYRLCSPHSSSSAGARAAALAAGMAHPHGLVDLAHDPPGIPVADGQKFFQRRIAAPELAGQCGPAPVEREEGLAHLRRQLGRQVVRMAVGDGRERFRGVEHHRLPRLHEAAALHA